MLLATLLSTLMAPSKIKLTIEMEKKLLELRLPPYYPTLISPPSIKSIWNTSAKKCHTACDL
jgi:hypothetical protein